jgi:Ca2+-binding RTX toxin-like protein
MANFNGTPGADLMIGTSGNDRFNTGLGVDTVYAGDGDDVIVSVDADGILDGGTGNDQVRILRTGSSTAFNIDLSTGNDSDIGDGTQLVSIERLWFEGGSANDTIIGGNMNDFLKGGGGSDFLSAGGGSDILVGGAGDTLLGGSGFDRFYISSAPALIDGGADNDIVTVTADLQFAAGSVTSIENFEVVDGVDADFRHLSQGTRIKVVDPSTVQSQFYEGPVPAPSSGSNILGTTFNDTLIGGTGDDTLSGGIGNDVVMGGDGNDFLQGWSGGDTLMGGDGDDTLASLFNQGPDTMDGGAGTDYARIDRSSASETTYSFDIELAGTQDIGDGTLITSIERINFEGGSGNDTGYGSSLNDVFSGGAGDDFFDGRGGEDRFTGGEGNDTFIGGAGTRDQAFYDTDYVDNDFLVTFDGTSYTITSTAYGTDTYQGVEFVRFNNQNFAIANLVD